VEKLALYFKNSFSLKTLCTVRNNFRCGIGKARSGKIPIPHRKYRYHIGFFRYHIGNTDMVSEKTHVVSVFPMWYRKKPMWYRYFRCGIGIFPLRAFSDTTPEIISNRVSLYKDLRLFGKMTL
jgi:hypothetical protein